MKRCLSLGGYPRQSRLSRLLDRGDCVSAAAARPSDAADLFAFQRRLATTEAQL